MLNLIMTHSPRMAAMTNNKRFGGDEANDVTVLHRLALRRSKSAAVPTTQATTAEQLRERTA